MEKRQLNTALVIKYCPRN